jgi:hypothetical protein
MTAMEGRTLVAVCDGCQRRQVLASGNNAAQLVEHPERMEAFTARTGWLVEPDKTECPDCAAGPTW